MRLRRGESRDGDGARLSLGRAMGKLETERAASGRVAEMRHSESGQTTIVMTFFLATFLFGFIAMGIDVESLFHAKRQAQAAADAAAIAAAEESSEGIASEQTAANAVAKLNGFDTTLANNPAIVTIHQTPTFGNYSGATAGSDLEVIVSQPIRTFFASMVTHKSTMMVSARAVASAGQTSPTCVCLEGATGTDLNLSNGAKLNPTGCGTTVDSNDPAAITIAGATLGGTSIGSVSSNWDNATNVNNNGSGQGVAAGTKVVEGLPYPACSPPVPTVPDPSTYTAAECGADPSTSGHYYNGSSFNIGPNSAYSTTQSTSSGNVVCYNSLLVGANGDVETLNPGIYIIKNGTLHFYGNGGMSNLGGNGVTFFLVGTANFVIDNGANVSLTAPTTGTYAGVVILQDPGDPTVPRAADTQPIGFAGGANTSFNGAIFAPAADVTLNNGTGTSVGADVVAKTLTMSGGGVLNSTPLASLGSFNISVAKIVE